MRDATKGAGFSHADPMLRATPRSASRPAGTAGAIMSAIAIVVRFMHILVPIAFALIIASMASALYFMMHDKGKSKRMVWSLATRVGLSISLFLFILFAHWMGWIQSTGIPMGR
jgi:predicted PurR-regulated permease PerM